MCESSRIYSDPVRKSYCFSNGFSGKDPYSTSNWQTPYSDFGITAFKPNVSLIEFRKFSIERRYPKPMWSSIEFCLDGIHDMNEEINISSIAFTNMIETDIVSLVGMRGLSLLSFDHINMISRVGDFMYHSIVSDAVLWNNVDRDQIISFILSCVSGDMSEIDMIDVARLCDVARPVLAEMSMCICDIVCYYGKPSQVSDYVKGVVR